MSRQWVADGADHVLVMAPGALSGLGGRPWSAAWLIRPASTSARGVFDAHSSTGTDGGILWSIEIDNTSYWLWNGSNINLMLPAEWQYIGVTVDTSTVRWHRYRLETSPGWTHQDAANSSINAGTINNVRVGKVSSGRFLGHMAAGALWAGAALSDGDHEAVGATALADWLAASPSVLWAFNQAAASDPVLDVTGGGADQSSVTGTAPDVSATEPPGWSYDLNGGDETTAGALPATVVLGAPTAAAGFQATSQTQLTVTYGATTVQAGLRSAAAAAVSAVVFGAPGARADLSATAEPFTLGAALGAATANLEASTPAGPLPLQLAYPDSAAAAALVAAAGSYTAGVTLPPATSEEVGDTPAEPLQVGVAYGTPHIAAALTTAAVALPIGVGFGPAVVGELASPTPASRTVTVAAQPRTSTPVGASRVVTPPAEGRTVDVD